jgi:hypothetical protein
MRTPGLYAGYPNAWRQTGATGRQRRLMIGHP